MRCALATRALNEDPTAFEGAREQERARVLGLLRLHGRDATSFQGLGHAYRYAFYEDACVAYADTGGAWVATGAPISAPARFAAIADAFVKDARAHGRRAVFFGVDAPFADCAAQLDTLRVGEQPEWDPRAWGETRRHTRSLREQIRRARAKGVRIARVQDATIARFEAPAMALVARWLRARAMAPMGFLVEVEPFRFTAERRYYGAYRGEALVAILVLTPIYARRGWFFENLLRDPSAPNGTTEALFDAAMSDLAAEGVSYATMGLAPLAGDVGPWLARARRWGRPLYDFAGLRAFKQKLRPVSCAPMLVAYPRGVHPAIAIYDVLSAFARGALFRFALATLLRMPRLLLRMLVALAVAWRSRAPHASGVSKRHGVSKRPVRTAESRRDLRESARHEVC